MSGFTLIELVVVVAIIGTVFFVAAPRLDQGLLRNESETAVNRLAETISRIKKKSAMEQRDYYLYYKSAPHRIVVSACAPGTECSETGEKTETIGVSLPDDLFVQSIQTMPARKNNMNQSFVRFYSKGYSDHALIQLKDASGEGYGCTIEPFLPGARIVKNDFF